MKMKSIRKSVFLTFCVLGSGFSNPAEGAEITLGRGEIRIVLAPDEYAPVKLAAENLVRDIKRVMEKEAVVVQDADPKNSGEGSVVILSNPNRSRFSRRIHLKDVDGFEAHRIYADPPSRTVVLQGADMRGTVYAVYAFSEKFLGVPPLWYWSTWMPEKRSEIKIDSDTDLLFRPPQVKYRAWFPNDQDMFAPWRSKSKENDEAWLETMLRLKLNTVELDNGIAFPDSVNHNVNLLRKYGLLLTAHHVSPLNMPLNQWDKYWKTVRKMDAPELSLANRDGLVEFWRHAVKVLNQNGVQPIWVIGFRGNGDIPFWETFRDAPKSMEERASIINAMVRVQLDLIKEITGQKEPEVRMIFYNELSDLLAAGLLKPPVGENMVWTFVAARRDHFPNRDIVNFDQAQKAKLGYYMNLQFTSTGSHLVQAEGPWKMEFNFRYVNSKSPLFFSVVNVGNLREHLLTMSANASMMWDLDRYSTDGFLSEFCGRYFGKPLAKKISGLYRDFFYAYWCQKKPDFAGMQRQYIFQDLRYHQAVRSLALRFFSPYDPNPLKDYPSEQLPGRTYSIVPGDNEATSQVDAMLHGMEKSSARFGEVAEQCDRAMGSMDAKYRPFFNDNLRIPAYFMHHLSRMFYHYVNAYTCTSDPERRVQELEIAYRDVLQASDHLLEGAHGNFETWYAGNSERGIFNVSELVKNVKSTLDAAKQLRP